MRALVFLLSLAAFHASAQTSAPPMVKEGRTVKISPHVHVILDELVPMVPNVGIVVGSKATLVVDPGMGARNGQIVLSEATKLRRYGELYVVNTHFHPEHATGEAGFPPSAKTIRARAQQQDIFEKEKTLDLGGVSVRLVRLGPGHTRGDTVFFVEQDRVLFSGDLVMSQLFPAFATPQSRVGSWLASLDALDARAQRVGELKRSGKSAADTTEAVRAEFPPKYPGWGQPLRVVAAANAIYAELP